MLRQEEEDYSVVPSHTKAEGHQTGYRYHLGKARVDEGRDTRSRLISKAVVLARNWQVIRDYNFNKGYMSNSLQMSGAATNEKEILNKYLRRMPLNVRADSMGISTIEVHAENILGAAPTLLSFCCIQFRLSRGILTVNETFMTPTTREHSKCPPYPLGRGGGSILVDLSLSGK